MEFKIKPLVAELVGTFWHVLGGCGAAVLAADFGVGGNGTSLRPHLRWSKKAAHQRWAVSPAVWR
jgi:glycerol uptake facilitator-like aquaporin